MPTSLSSDSNRIDSIFEQMRDLLGQFLLLLSQKEKFVIERRFNLDEKSRATLEEIGQHFHVTRERVRQIEKNALQKLRRNIENSPLNVLNDLVMFFLQEAGGVLREDILLSKLIQHESQYSAAVATLIVTLDKRFDRLPNTIDCHPYVKFKTISDDFVQSLTQYSLNFLRRHKDVVPLSHMAAELKNHLPQAEFLTESLLKSFYQTHKNFKLLENTVGLFEWRHIHPRTLRDKIFFILRHEHKPLHFMEISNLIVKSQFDQKNINLQAVHNELIRCDHFILIGRGIYALQEWGYHSGTVSDVIRSILLKKGSLNQDQIIAEVLKERQVKPITIILNLKNDQQFTRVGRKQYALRNDEIRKSNVK